MMNSVTINGKDCRMDGASPNFITCFTPPNEEGDYEVIVKVMGVQASCNVC